MPNAELFRKILLVDPDPKSQAFLQEALKDKNYEIVRAESWEEGQSQIRRQGFSAVITEWFGSPGRSGGAGSPFTRPEIPFYLFTTTDPEASCPDWAKVGYQGAWTKSRKHRLLQALMDLEFEAPVLPPLATGFKPAPKDPGQFNILIIDDSPTVRGFIRRTLEGAFPNCILREAEDGRMALSEMTQKKVDLIFTDLDMPGMDGKTFLKLIRNNPILKSKPIIVLSGSVSQDILNDYRSVDLVKVLRKPSSADEIAKCAKELLGVSAA